MTRFEI